jgi:hypothetical protein
MVSSSLQKMLIDVERTPREWILSSGKINWGNNMENRPLDYKCETIFKSKRNRKKMVNGWDVKIKENWRKTNWKDPFSP